ncbi:MAG: barstar family protein [Clostridiales bacterium]|nr:barstar family protein [Clostridia bacterium]MCR4883833.1 barstar family protein [Clostridiales bacterium]
MTLFLDGDLYATAQDLHLALKRMLALPDYYGMNGDALYDCLSERREPVSVYIATRGNDEVSRALDIICHVIADLGGEVKNA